MSERWEVGRRVFQEGVTPFGKLVEVRPAVVVEDSERCLGLYFPAGSVWLSGDWMHGRERYRLSLEERVREFASEKVLELEERLVPRHVLSLLPHGALHACWFFWTRDWRPEVMFVNFQAPFERVGGGIRVADYYLDIRLGLDMSWQWKDEDEFAAMVDVGVVSREMEGRIRSDAAKVVRRIEAREWPWDVERGSWRPEVEWERALDVKEMWGGGVYG